MAINVTFPGLELLVQRWGQAETLMREPVRKASFLIAQHVAEQAKDATRRSTPQLKAAGTTLAAIDGKDPHVFAGGDVQVVSRGGTAGELWFGANFGSFNHPQFPSRGPQVVYTSIDNSGPETDRYFGDALEEVF